MKLEMGNFSDLPEIVLIHELMEESVSDRRLNFSYVYLCQV